MFSLIACIGKNRELGKKNQLIFHIKEDMRFFRDTTRGHTVVMGRKTWESLPGKLPGRKNIVVSSREVPGADETISDISDFVAKILHYEEIWQPSTKSPADLQVESNQAVHNQQHCSIYCRHSNRIISVMADQFSICSENSCNYRKCKA